MKKQDCCTDMQAARHVDYEQYPDIISTSLPPISYSPKWDEYSLNKEAELTSMPIRFCPFCGTDLPSRRQQWFEALARLGFERPEAQEIPVEYLDDRWWTGLDRRLVDY